MRLNGLGAPDETTLVPLKTVDAVVTEGKKEQQQRGYCFHCGKYDHYKAQCRRLQKERHYATETGNTDLNQPEAPKPSAARAENCTKPKNANRDGANAANDPRKQTRKIAIPTNQISGQPVLTVSSQPNT